MPLAKDGTGFLPDSCKSKRGTYTVGEKGEEVRFENFEEALTYLSRMKVAKWRRPNSQGNWGIVSAVEWVELV